jgi:hypothetical protein
VVRTKRTASMLAMLRRMGIVAGLTALAACDLMSSDLGKLDPGRSVIFPAERARELVQQCSRDVPAPIESTWTPTEAQVRSLEPRLAALLVQEARRGDFPETKIEVAEYYRQYGGFTVGGKRLIYVNGFHRHLAGGSWRSEVPLVCDGGYGLFGVEYDPETREFANFHFNSPG